MNVARGSRLILLNGMAMVLVGLVWGLIVPTTPYPRLALVAHVQLTSNGILFIVLAILLTTLPHRVGSKSILVMLLAAGLTWMMVGTEIANSWWGTTQKLAIAGQQAGAPGGQPWQELAMILAHNSAGPAMISSWTLLLIGFARGGRAQS